MFKLENISALICLDARLRNLWKTKKLASRWISFRAMKALATVLTLDCQVVGSNSVNGIY